MKQTKSLECIGKFDYDMVGDSDSLLLEYSKILLTLSRISRNAFSAIAIEDSE